MIRPDASAVDTLDVLRLRELLNGWHNRPTQVFRLRSLPSSKSETARLANAIAGGGDMPALMAALHAREAQRRDLLACNTRPRMKPVDVEAIMSDLPERVADWRQLLRDTRPTHEPS
jgi:hypothetical protein